MKKILMTLFLSFMALGLSVGDAEAARMGGGRSVGMQRQAVTPPARPAQQQAAPGAPAAAPAAAAASRNSWLGPIAGLAAGIGLAALFSHLGLGEGLANVVTLSTMRGREFIENYGVAIAAGPLAGITARAVVVLDENNVVLHSELVAEIKNEPDYAAALAVL